MLLGVTVTVVVAASVGKTITTLSAKASPNGANVARMRLNRIAPPRCLRESCSAIRLQERYVTQHRSALIDHTRQPKGKPETARCQDGIERSRLSATAVEVRDYVRGEALQLQRRRPERRAEGERLGVGAAGRDVRSGERIGHDRVIVDAVVHQRAK